MRTLLLVEGSVTACLLASAAFAGSCLLVLEVNCCNYIEYPPKNRPRCPNDPPQVTSCNDLVVADPTIKYVFTSSAGVKGQIVSLPQQQCSYDVRDCNQLGNCATIEGSPLTYNCYSSQVAEPAEACP